VKAPWFPFYAGDFLASPDVQLMEVHEVGAYLLLLLHSWQSNEPGYLPNDEGRLRRAARLTVDMWADCRELLLSKWPLAENGLRHNPRLVREAAIQLARRERLANNGAKGGRPAQNQKDNKQKAKNNLQVTEDEPIAFSEEPTGLLSQPQSQLTKVSKQADELAAKPKPVERRLPLPAEDVQLFKAADWPSLADPQKFANVCAQLDFPQVDFERYRKQIIVSLEGKELPATSLRNWIKTYLNNDKDADTLLVPKAQTPNERPSNYTGTTPYVPQPGGRIPDMSSIVNPNWKPPTA